MTEVQPMKMAAAEAPLHHRAARASFSVLTIGSLDGSREVFALKIPYLLSFLATGDLDGDGPGHQRPAGRVRAASTAPATTRPIIPVTYWSFRFMIGFGMAAARDRRCSALWSHAQGPHPDQPVAAARRRWPCRVLPLLANSFGWIFTEMGRQPWIVFGEMLTARRRLAAASRWPRCSPRYRLHRCSTPRSP